MEGLLSRRSVRQYDETKKVSKEDITKILKAAQYAPSAHNKQAWEFLVVEDKEILTGLRAIQPFTSFAKGASCMILVCADTDHAFARPKEGWSYEDIDCSAATQNILLAAHALGLGACWCGCTPMTATMEKTKELFNLPANIKPFAFVTIGHQVVEAKQPKERFIEEKVHWHKW